MMGSKTLVITHSNFFADFIKNIIPDKNIVFHIVLNLFLDKIIMIFKTIFFLESIVLHI
jgi:hypothetical protein